jgi:hypothetical protein
MVEYEYLKPLFEFFKVIFFPKKHWTDVSRWVMWEHIHYQVLKALKATIVGVSFLLISCDDMTSINNQQWLSVHVNVLDNWVHTPLFLSMARSLVNQMHKI